MRLLMKLLSRRRKRGTQMLAKPAWFGEARNLPLAVLHATTHGIAPPAISIQTTV